jgi:hypothetical protein
MLEQVRRQHIVEVCFFFCYENIDSSQSESWGMSAKCHCVLIRFVSLFDPALMNWFAICIVSLGLYYTSKKKNWFSIFMECTEHFED